MILLDEIRTANQIKIFPGLFNYQLEIKDLLLMISKYEHCHTMVLVLDWYLLGSQELEIISKFRLTRLVLQGIENKKVLKGFSTKFIKNIYSLQLNYLHLDCYGLKFKRIVPLLSIPKLSLVNLKELDLDLVASTLLTIYFKKRNMYQMDPILMMNILLANECRIIPEIKGKFKGKELKLVFENPDQLLPLVDSLGLKVLTRSKSFILCGN
ncbi:hypothetical protein HDV01_006113 [Terramyces sp. JEL0728]|nr:hypothetical protein HDV01_006113 [Terramyces sp. JEL0728]